MVVFGGSIAGNTTSATLTVNGTPYTSSATATQTLTTNVCLVPGTYPYTISATFTRTGANYGGNYVQLSCGSTC